MAVAALLFSVPIFIVVVVFHKCQKMLSELNPANAIVIEIIACVALLALIVILVYFTLRRGGEDVSDWGPRDFAWKAILDFNNPDNANDGSYWGSYWGQEREKGRRVRKIPFSEEKRLRRLFISAYEEDGKRFATYNEFLAYAGGYQGRYAKYMAKRGSP
jgi:hypothetical protein